MKSPMLRFKDVRVLRGGSWYGNNADFFRAHYRLRFAPGNRFNNRGFRCVSPEKSEVVKRFVRIG